MPRNFPRCHQNCIEPDIAVLLSEEETEQLKESFVAAERIPPVSEPARVQDRALELAVTQLRNRLQESIAIPTRQGDRAAAGGARSIVGIRTVGVVLAAGTVLGLVIFWLLRRRRLTAR